MTSALATVRFQHPISKIRYLPTQVQNCRRTRVRARGELDRVLRERKVQQAADRLARPFRRAHRQPDRPHQLPRRRLRHPITVSIRASFLTRIYGTFPGTDLDDGEFQTNSSSRSRGSSSNLTLIRLRQTHQSTPTLKNQRNDKSKARAGLGGVVAARAPRHFAPRAHEPRTAHAHRPVRETDEVQDSISDSPQRSRVSRGLSSLRRFATISRESRWRKTETATRTFELSIVLKGPTAPCPRSLSKSTTQLFQIEILLPRTPTPTTRPPQCTSRARCTRQDTRLRALSLSLVVFFLSLFEMRAEENTTDDDEKRSSNSRACQERDSLPARALSLSLSLSLGAMLCDARTWDRPSSSSNGSV